MAYTAKLVIKRYNSLEFSDTSRDLEMVLGDESTITKDVTGKSVSIKFKLNSLRVYKKIYSPHRVIADISISGEVPSYGSLKEMFLRKTATFEIKNTEKNVVKGEKYFVHEVCPKYVSGSNGTETRLILEIGSLDKLLTLDKYSQAYLGRRLQSELLASASRFSLSYNYYNLNGERQVATTSVPVNGNSGQYKLQHLFYETHDTIQKEYIQPYLVQYNETFYDFLVRVANRCGEFLFFENDALNIGLPAGSPTEMVREQDKIDAKSERKKQAFKNVTPDATINDFMELELPAATSGVFDVKDYSRDTLKDPVESFGSSKTFNMGGVGKEEYGEQFYKNSGGEEPVEYPADTNFFDKETENHYYNSEIAHDEFFMPLYKEGFNTRYPSELSRGNMGKYFADGIMALLNSTSLLELISKGAIEVKDLALLYARYWTIRGNRGKDRFIKPNAPANSANMYGNKYQEEPDRVVPFSEDELQRWTTLEYYSDIKKYQEEQQKQMITAKMGANLRALSLGETVKFKESDEYYIICEVNTELDSAGTVSQELKAIPMHKVVNKADGSTGYLTIVGYQAYPPMHEGGVFRKSGPQTAFVSDTADPKRQGRVRIKYPWQNSAPVIERDKNVAYGNVPDSDLEDYFNMLDEAATPWIRMSSPSATDGAGIYFEPEPGDEVIVNFENDNIERPCVVGTLYSKNTQPPSLRGRRVIVSKLGHMIRFNDPTDGIGEVTDSTGGWRIVESISPLLSTYTFFAGDDNYIPLDTEEGHKLTGGIDICDAYGLYSLSMSSDKRSVQISSPVGDVTINAFTGITISAPNGNIKISGKNIELEASNKISLVSGTNLDGDGWFKSGFLDKQGKFSLSQGVKNVGTALAKNITEQFFPIDLELLRTFYEIFMRPVNGSFEIKSYSFITMEAGEGDAQIPLNSFTDKFRAKAMTTISENWEKEAINHVTTYIDKSKRLVLDFINPVIAQYTTFIQKLRVFKANYIDPDYLNEITDIPTLISKLYNVRDYIFQAGNTKKMVDFDNGHPLQEEGRQENMLNEFNQWKDTLQREFNDLKRHIWGPEGIKSLIEFTRFEKPTRINWFYHDKDLGIDKLLADSLNEDFKSGKYIFDITSKLVKGEGINDMIAAHIVQLPQELWENEIKITLRHLFINLASKFGTIYKSIKMNFNIPEDVGDDGLWSTAVNNLEFKYDQNVVFKHFVDYANDLTNIFSDGSNVWDSTAPNGKGKILFSENPGSTIKFDANGAGLTSTDNVLKPGEEKINSALGIVKTKLHNLD